MKPSSSPRQLILISAALMVLLPLIPFGSTLLMPLAYLNVVVHESCHAIVTIATGGAVQNITIFPNGSGVTMSLGGIGLLISPAGYIGSALVGAALMFAGSQEKTAVRSLQIFGIAIALSTLLWIRGEAIGLLAAVVYAVALIFASHRLTGTSARFVATFIGLHQCLASIEAITTLLKITSLGHQENDAANMAQMTGLPAIFWAILWFAISASFCWLSLRRSWSRG